MIEFDGKERVTFSPFFKGAYLVSSEVSTYKCLVDFPVSKKGSKDLHKGIDNLVVVKIEGQLCAVTLTEMKSHGLKEITLKRKFVTEHKFTWEEVY